ncbi:hypothetical protein SAMN04489743_1683 [Pseudarthrobacter equi]|uniref:Short C-terminal domain-containing protein n=1 Tax=Pseudarthrobacter equi TaxID=728066 RepID=A0A1H1XKN3_9MICC|nr:hypothetical protein [Pseudarthrobacter equi]SDT09770.1 hypothetical protein SAMN04489743_1683 [Pseudarthrobacter equi]
MSNLFFWIIILSFVIPMAMRMYRKSVAKRNHDQSFPGRYPEQFPGAGQYPGSQNPGGQFPGSAGPQSRQPRDGYTQQDYYSGGFRQIGQQAPNVPQPGPYQYGQPPVPGQGGQPFGQPPYGEQQFSQPPYNQPQPGQQQPGYPAPEQPAAPATPPPPSAPQGFRARKLAELDQKYSNGEMSMEDYMARRSEIMNG